MICATCSRLAQPKRKSHPEIMGQAHGRDVAAQSKHSNWHGRVIDMVRFSHSHCGYRSATKMRCKLELRKRKHLPKNRNPNQRKYRRMALTREQQEKLRTQIVEVILSYRRQYLASGSSALTHWDVLQNRALSAARRTGTIDRWTSMYRKNLQLPAPDSLGSSAILDLTTFVRELGSGADGQALAIIREEIGLLMAMARKCAEERKEARGNDSL